MYEASCDDIEVSQNPEADKSFLNRISDLCNSYFPKEQQINLKSKDLQSPWITNGIKKFSNRKQRLYEKYLKNRNEKSELNTKFTKDFLNTLNIPKNYKFLLLFLNTNITWQDIKESIGKEKCNHQSFLIEIERQTEKI